jgi:hypothetical protein
MVILKRTRKNWLGYLRRVLTVGVFVRRPKPSPLAHRGGYEIERTLPKTQIKKLIILLNNDEKYDASFTSSYFRVSKRFFRRLFDRPVKYVRLLKPGEPGGVIDSATATVDFAVEGKKSSMIDSSLGIPNTRAVARSRSSWNGVKTTCGIGNEIDAGGWKSILRTVRFFSPPPSPESRLCRVLDSLE